IVIARLVRNGAQERAIQYAETSVMNPRSRGVLDPPHARGMTVSARRDSDEAIHLSPSFRGAKRTRNLEILR
ncbi:hypothetical protein, partial [Staphylococcus aureus]